MKKQIIFLFLFLQIGFSLVKAQTIEIGLEGSAILNYSKLQFGDTIWTGFRKNHFEPFLIGGPMLRFNYKERLSLNFGVQHFSSGFRYFLQFDYNYPATKVKGNGFLRVISTSYTDLPIFIQYKLPINKAAKNYFFARAGTRLIYTWKDRYSAIFSSKFLDTDNGIDSVTIVNKSNSRKGLKPSLLLGLGWAKSFNFGGKIELALVYNQAFKVQSTSNTELVIKNRLYNINVDRFNTYLGFSCSFYYRIPPLKKRQ